MLKQFRASSAGSVPYISGGAASITPSALLWTPAPPREGADKITVEAYSHEVISHGFWPGQRLPGRVDFRLAVPRILRFRRVPKPKQPSIQNESGFLPYDDVVRQVFLT
jgi:hypothetical protein